MTSRKTHADDGRGRRADEIVRRIKSDQNPETEARWPCFHSWTASTRSPASGLLALARAAGGAGDPSLHRAGVRVQRLQPAADATHRRHGLRAGDWKLRRSAGCSASRSCSSGSRRRCSARGSSASGREGDVRLGAVLRRRILVAALGVALHQFWLLLLGYGVLGGIGLGLGYISPVSTLIKWFPDRPGMATGMAIMGFGGGAMIASPLSTALMAHFKPTSSRASRRRSSRWGCSISRS